MVNRVGSILLKPAHLTKPEEFMDVLQQNLVTAFNVVRAAAKGGVNGLVLSAAATYGPRGLRVNAVAPGLVRTPLAARITGSPAAEQASVAMHALGRLGEADDVAPAIVWLLGAEASWVTGQLVGVDGGLGTVRRAG